MAKRRTSNNASPFLRDFAMSLAIITLALLAIAVVVVSCIYLMSLFDNRIYAWVIVGVVMVLVMAFHMTCHLRKKERDNSSQQ